MYGVVKKATQTTAKAGKTERSSSETLLSLHQPPPAGPLAAGADSPHRRMSAQPTTVTAATALESRPCSAAAGAGAGAGGRIPQISEDMMGFADLLAIEKGRGFQVSHAVLRFSYHVTHVDQPVLLWGGRIYHGTLWRVLSVFRMQDEFSPRPHSTQMQVTCNVLG